MRSWRHVNSRLWTGFSDGQREIRRDTRLRVWLSLDGCVDTAHGDEFRELPTWLTMTIGFPRAGVEDFAREPGGQYPAESSGSKERRDLTL